LWYVRILCACMWFLSLFLSLWNPSL
jgi:hypothetical protein